MGSVVILAVMSAAPAQQRPTFHTAIDTVTVSATVKHRNGRLVPDLRREDFQILVDGRPVDTTVFLRERHVLTMALVLDVSNSMLSRYSWVRAVAHHVVSAVERDDRVRIVTLGTEVALSPHLTGDQARLRRILRDEVWPGGGTPLWWTLEATFASIRTESGRRAALVVSDGRAPLPGIAGEVGPVQLGERAQEDRLMTYAVAPAATQLSPPVTALADRTGGGHAVLDDDVDLGAEMQRVLEEIRHEYVIGFSPPALDGRAHRLTIRTTDDRHRVRAPDRFLAARKTP
jgi:VWFA-related protein